MTTLLNEPIEKLKTRVKGHVVLPDDPNYDEIRQIWNAMIDRKYWDQASVLVQIGLLDPGTLPVVGIDSARKAINPNLPSNALIDLASDRD